MLGSSGDTRAVAKGKLSVETSGLGWQLMRVAFVILVVHGVRALDRHAYMSALVALIGVVLMAYSGVRSAMTRSECG